MAKFLRCEHCGNIVGVIEDSGVPMKCCGQNMTELVANTSDGAKEKHVPVVNATEKSVMVTIGSVMHPMTPEHSIEWIYLETSKGGQRHKLCNTCDPMTKFAIDNAEKPLAVYAYCNLHGLWKVEI